MKNIFETPKEPKSIKMTKARLKALQQGFKDGGEIIIGGIDETVPKPRADVVTALQYMGYLNSPVGTTHDRYSFTEKAFQYFKKNS